MLEKCKNCGAEIEYSAETQSLKCQYCDTVNQIHKPEDDLPDHVDSIIPLATSLDALEKRVYGFMASGDYTPDDMLEAARFVKRECFYVPAYLFSIDYEATWTASFGFDRQEPYTAYRTVTSNGRSRQEAYTAYRTVTDWRPANGVDSGVFGLSIYAGQQLHASGLTPSAIVPHVIENGKATSFNDSFMTGFSAENFAISEANAFDTLDGEINANIDRRVKNHAQGDHQQDWHWNARMSHGSSTIYVPLSHAIFDYQGTEYHYWADGVDGKTVRADQLPVDQEREKLVNKGFIPAVAAIVGAVAGIALWSFSWTSLGVVLALAAYGAVRKDAIIGYSKNIRNALLVQMQASSTSGKDLSVEDQERYSQAFQRPERSYFARTHNDMALIPSLAVAAFLSALIPAYLASPSYASKADSAAAQAPVDEQPQASTAAAQPPQENPVREEASHPAVGEPSASAAAVPETVQGMQAMPGGRVAELINLAAGGRWQAIDQLAKEIQGQAVQVAQGDRKLGRSLNQEGIALLRQNDFDAAIDAFTDGLDADPSDIELSNNLAYAQLLSGDLNSAEKLLYEVLSRAPDRAAAWSNLSELYARTGEAQINTAHSSLRLAVHFSQNRQKAPEILKRVAQGHAVPLYREVASRVLKELEYIPGR